MTVKTGYAQDPIDQARLTARVLDRGNYYWKRSSLFAATARVKVFGSFDKDWPGYLLDGNGGLLPKGAEPVYLTVSIRDLFTGKATNSAGEQFCLNGHPYAKEAVDNIDRGRQSTVQIWDEAVVPIPKLNLDNVPLPVHVVNGWEFPKKEETESDEPIIRVESDLGQR